MNLILTSFLRRIPGFVLLFMLLSTTAAAQLPADSDNEAGREPLNLNEVIQAALEHYPELKMHEQEIQKAGLKRRQVLQTLLPKVSLEGSYTFLDNPIAIGLPELSLEVSPGLELSPDLPDAQLQSDRFFQSRVQIEQVLFTGGEVLYGARAAEHGKSARAHQAEAAKAALIKEVIEAWNRITLFKQSVRVTQEALERVGFEQTRAEQAWEEGLLPYYDITRIRVFRRQLMDQQTELKGRLELTYEQLSRLSGLPAEAFSTLSPETDMLGWSDAEEHSWRGRPEWQAAGENVRAREQLLRAERGAYLPTVFAFFQRELYEDDLTSLDPVWAAGAGFRWTVFNRGQTRTGIELARRDLNIAREQRALAADGFELRLRQAGIDRDVAERRLQTAELMVEESEVSLDLATRRYELGLSDVSERLQAETDLQEALLSQKKAIYALQRARVKELAATGALRPALFSTE